MTSPSPGIRSPASTTTTSPTRSCVLGTSSIGSSSGCRAELVAPPRPGGPWSPAAALAGWLPAPCRGPRRRTRRECAKRTVSHSQTVTQTSQGRCGSSDRHARSWRRRRSRRRASPGCRRSWRGSSLRSAPGSAVASSSPESSARRRLVVVVRGRRGLLGASVSGRSCEGLHDRAEGERGDEGQADHDQRDAGEQADEERPVGGQGAGARREPLPGWRTGRRGRARRRSAGTGRASMQSPSSDVPEGGVRGEAGEGACRCCWPPTCTAYSASERPCGPDSCERRPGPASAVSAMAAPISTSDGRDQHVERDEHRSRAGRSSCRGTRACARPSDRRGTPRPPRASSMP